MYDAPLFLPAGDQALIVELGDEIDPDVNRRVHDLMRSVEGQGIPGVVDLVPTYRSLLVQYDATRTTLPELEEALAGVERGLSGEALETPRVVHIPTLYGGDYGPDLPYVAEQAGLTADEVIQVHSDGEYLVYMMGFTPGFPYLGGLEERLATPRLATPRQVIPEGSVGIAEGQTGVYPVASPGGWRLIGRTPLRLFDPMRGPSSLIVAGDRVRFVPLDGEEEYVRVRDQVESGEYQLPTGAGQ